MPAKFVDHILMRDEPEAAMSIQSLPDKKTIRICVENADHSAAIYVPYDLVPELAQRMCNMLAKAGRVILTTDDQYPDY